MQIIPIKPVAAQALIVSLGQQITQISLYQKGTGSYYALYCDIYLGNTLLVGGVICLDRTRIIRNQYFGFVGDLGFADQHGTQDPDYTGLGTRYLLYYLEAADIGTALDV